MPNQLIAVREALADLTVPTPGGDTLTWGDILNDNSLQKLLNMVHGVAPLVGTLANRPAANTVLTNTLFIANDGGSTNLIYRSDGSTWVLLSTVLMGTLAARPAAADVPNALYIVTDSAPPNAIYRSDGASWVQLDAVPTIGATVRLATAQSISTTVWTNVAFDTEVEDTDGMWVSTSPSVVTFQTPGRYLAVAQGTYADATGGSRLFRWGGTAERSGASHVTAQPDPGGRSGAAMSLATNALAGETIQLQTFQDTANAINLLRARLSVYRLGG